MKINQLLVESEQIDELSALDVGRGIGSAVGKTAQAVGGVVGGLRGAAGAFKQGYQSGKGFVSGQKVGRTNPQPGSVAPRPTASGGAPNLDAMADQDLEAMKKQIDATLAARKQQPAEPEQQAGAQAAPAGNAAPVASKPKTGDKVSVDGKDYQWLGAQWAEVNPATGKAGKIAPAALRAKLDAAPRTPGVTVQAGGKAKKPATTPAAAPAAPTSATAESFRSKFLGIDL